MRVARTDVDVRMEIPGAVMLDFYFSASVRRRLAITGVIHAMHSLRAASPRSSSRTDRSTRATARRHGPRRSTARLAIPIRRPVTHHPIARIARISGPDPGAMPRRRSWLFPSDR